MTLTTTPKAVALLAVALALTDVATDTAAAATTTNTPGALLFHFSSEPVSSSGPRQSVAHVAISLGAGNR